MQQKPSPCVLGQPFAAWLAEPLPQRPAGSPGKDGVCDVTFTVVHGRTSLLRSFVSHPFHLTRPWYLDAALPQMAVLYVQMPAGGLIQGDRTQLRFQLEYDAQVHITTPAAEKIHRMTANCAVQQVGLSLGTNAYAEYCPEPILLFPDARFVQEIVVTLAARASFFFSEIFIAPTLHQGAPFAGVSTHFQVQDTSGRLLFGERSLLVPAEQPLSAPGILGKAHCWGQAVFMTERVSATCTHHLHTQLKDEPGVVSGVSTLPGERGIIVKALGSEVRAVRATLYAAWNYVRTTYIGVPATVYPK